MIRRLIGCAALCLMGPAASLAETHSGDAEAGEQVFRRCQACHDVGADAENKVGPVLNGIIDREIASVEGFEYSKVLAEMGAAGEIWSAENMSAFLKRPRDYASGTKMSFAGLRKDEDRANVIAYLASFGDEDA